ncbi:MAG TPA: Ig-like domain-containing protein [Acidimicrobiales bacterium]|nr:Ig-like domain-containing protein [Acidimicrobiales bacterium]
MDNLVRDNAPDDGRGHDGEGAAGNTGRHRRLRRPPSRRGLLLSLSAVVAATALVVALVGVWGSPGGSQAAPATSAISYRDQQRAAAADRISSGDPTCAEPTQQSGQTVQSDVQAETVGEGGSVAGEIFRELGLGAVGFAEDEGLGWLLNLIGGGENGLSPAEVDQQFDLVNSKIDALSNQQYQDCTAVLATLAQLSTNVDKDAYDNLVGPMAREIALVTTYTQDFDNIVSALGRNGGQVDALSSDYKADMEKMVSGGPDGLRDIVNTINVLEGGNQPGADAMATFYAKILVDEAHYDPYKTHIFPAGFVNQGSDQQGYYASIVAQAVYLYSNVAHLDFTGDGGYSHSSDPDGVVSLVNIAQKDVQSWSAAFADGPVGDGTPNWVSQGKGLGIGRLPDGTVLDYRAQAHPMLWTDAPVGLNGDPVSPAPYYCGTTAAFCYADRYNPAGQVGDTSLVPSSPQPLADMVAAEDYEGAQGWRVPTSADWAALEAGATGGLTVWGAAHQLDMFASEKTTLHYGGTDQTLTTIAPVLVNTGSVGTPVYGVLSSTDPAANTLTLEKPDLGGSHQDDVAGRLFLAMDFQPTPVPTPFSSNGETSVTTTSTTTTTAPSTTTTTTDASTTTTSTTTTGPTTSTTATTGPTPTTSPADNGTGQPAPSQASSDDVVQVSSDSSADVPGPTTFSSPVACSTANTYTVPAGVGSLRITATGGAGAPGEVGNKATAPGGLGGVVTETVPAIAGSTLYLQVGGAGSAGDSRQGGTGGGGTGGVSKSEHSNSGDYSGGGGGASGISTTPNCNHWLVVAGGGGGGGAGLNASGNDPEYDGGHGGDGCPVPPAPNCKTATDGSQGHQYRISAGHAGGAQPNNRGGDTGRDPDGHPYGTAGANGGTMQGGNGGTNNSSYVGGGGGGGGAGYYGGGGGAGSGWNAAGGGGAGGASFAVPGAQGVSYGLGTAGQNGSLTITPIAKAPLPITLSVSPDHVAWQQPLPVTLTASVPVDATGSIAFYNSLDQVAGTAPIRHGIATLTSLKYAPLVGTEHMWATYTGDAHYLGNNSNGVYIQVAKADPGLHLTVSGTVLKSGQPPTSIVAQMSPYAAGSVKFYDDINNGCEGNTSSGAACVDEGSAAPNTQGYATLTTLATPLVPGKNTLYASYAGDSSYGQYSEFNPGVSNKVVVIAAGS